MVRGHGSRWLLLGALAVVALTPRGGRSVPVAAASLTFTVNSTVDAPDVNPGDGICADSSGQCTLRAAIQEADAQPSGSRIAIDVPAGTYGLTLGTLQLTANNITISGALSSTTIISGNDTSTIVGISPTVQASLSQVTITGGNAGSASGGGLTNRGVTVLSQSLVLSNTATSGSGVYNAHGGRLSLVGSTLRGNSTYYHGSETGLGGGIYNDGTLSVAHSTISNNVAQNGGGITNHGAAAIVANSTLSGNSARLTGGGILNRTGTLTLTNSSISSNSAPYGAGLVNYGTVTVKTSTLSNNRGQYGGGIDNEGGTVTLSTSTLSGNSTSGYGGGIYNIAMLAVTNSTFSGNTATQDGGGLDTSGNATVTTSTFSGNSAGGTGGDIYVYTGNTMALTGTIVAYSRDGANCAGRFVEGRGYNLDSGTSCGFNKQTDLTNTDPLLGPLQNNGGPTQTMALLSGSPAIDHGSTHATGCPATDQRGMPRPDEAKDNGACDMGAYESQGVG